MAEKIQEWMDAKKLKNERRIIDCKERVAVVEVRMAFDYLSMNIESVFYLDNVNDKTCMFSLYCLPSSNMFYIFFSYAMFHGDGNLTRNKNTFFKNIMTKQKRERDNRNWKATSEK